jgi:hypothetical protein
MIATDKDRDILARTLWGEARGEGTAGQIGAAWTPAMRPVGLSSNWDDYRKPTASRVKPS